METKIIDLQKGPTFDAMMAHLLNILMMSKDSIRAGMNYRLHFYV
jgi:hypothetical protein